MCCVNSIKKYITVLQFEGPVKIKVKVKDKGKGKGKIHPTTSHEGP